MSEPIVVEVRRNGVVEATHRVHAVAVRGGEVVAAAGDPSLTCFMRSSSKPLQALPLVRARDDLPDDELAIACASHHDTPEQVAAVRALLARAEATEDDLELGIQEGRPSAEDPPQLLGKARGDARSVPRPRLADARLPRVRASGAAGLSRDLMPRPPRSSPQEAASDGCGVVTFALPLERMAHAYSRLEALPGGDRIAAAMRARPDLVGGPDGADFLLMRAAPGWLAKGGAEGLLCAAGADGLGVALKTEDGASRAHAPALATFLGTLGLDLPDLAEVPVVNSRGERVGEIVTAR